MISLSFIFHWIKKEVQFFQTHKLAQNAKPVQMHITFFTERNENQMCLAGLNRIYIM